MNINQEANMDNMQHMEPRHFALPASFVLTLLAFFFFGMNHPTRPTHTLEPLKIPKPIGNDDTPKHDDPPPIIEVSESDTVEPPVSGGGEPPPTADIDLSWSQKTDAFFIPMEPPRLRSGDGDIRVIPAYYGPGHGSGDRPGTASSIIPARLLDKPPQARVQTSPVYPVREKSDGLTGTVEVEFTVDETGAVVNPWVVSSTHRAFEEPTLRAVEKWRFAPGRHLGQVVKFRMRVPVLFNLSD